MPQIRAMLGGETADLQDGLRLHWEPGSIEVEFSNGRKQKVRYKLKGEHYLFTSRVATRNAIRHKLEDVAREILLRNRTTRVVAFGLGRNEAVEAWIYQRASTLQSEELKFYIAKLAREADRFEYLLTGADVN